MNELKIIKRKNLKALIDIDGVERKELAEALDCTRQFISHLTAPIDQTDFRSLSDEHIEKIVIHLGSKYGFDESYFYKGIEKIYGNKTETLKDKKIKELETKIADLKEVFSETKELKNDYKDDAKNLKLIVEKKTKEYNELVDVFCGRQRKDDSNSEGKNGGHLKDRKLPHRLSLEPPLPK